MSPSPSKSNESNNQPFSRFFNCSLIVAVLVSITSQKIDAEHGIAGVIQSEGWSNGRKKGVGPGVRIIQSRSNLT